MPNGPHSWNPCYVDPWRGVAHFDSLTIEADPITSARPDRVLPCIEDEQVYFCRMVKALLPGDGDRDGRLAVDLGAGSGVLSLYARSLGMNVTGVDICDRAINFANHNWRQNKSVDSPDNKSIEFRCGDWNVPDTLEGLLGTADYVFVNPPFSPHLDGQECPTCASGGVNGQKAFLQTLQLAYSLLKEHGRVFAIQLLLTDSCRRPIDDLFAATGTPDAYWASVRIFPALQEGAIPVPEFVAGQYVGYPRDSTESIGGTNEYFCFAFVELTKDKSKGKPEFRVISPNRNPLAPLPNWTWEERIRMHRTVSASVSNPNDDSKSLNRTRFPSISLFLKRTTPHVNADSKNRDPSNESPVLTPIQIALDGWICENELLRDRRKSSFAGFDCIMVEAVPWHLARNRLSLSSETAVWTRRKSRSKEKAPNVSRALARVLAEIRRLHEEGRSIFRHPDLVEGSVSRLWQEAICLHHMETASNVDDPWPPSNVSVTPGLFETEETLVSSYQHELNALGIDYRNPSGLDFADCLSKAISAYTGIMRQEGLFESCFSHCYFMALPMPLPRPSDEDGSSGIVYVYAWSTQDWSSSHEILAADLARISACLYEEFYSKATRYELREKQRQSLLRTAAHETKSLIHHIDEKLTSQLGLLVRDYILLNLELDLGDTFKQAHHLLRKNFCEAVLELAQLTFLYSAICEVNLDPKKVDDRFIDKHRADARGWIELDGEALSTVSVTVPDPDKQKIALHFIAGFLSGLRNAIQHSNKFGRTPEKIKITLREKYIVIENEYVSKRDCQEDIEAFASKNESEDTGTEAVLKYHARALSASQVSGCRIERASCVPQDATSYRHTWRTWFPIP